MSGRKKSLSFEHASLTSAVAGDVRLKPSFAFTPEWDRLFALGYPHLTLLTNEPVANLEKALLELFNKNPFTVEYPRAAALAAARLMPRPREAFRPGTHDLSDFAHETLKNERAITTTEAGTLVERLFEGFWIDRHRQVALSLLEALVGPPVVEALIARLEHLSPASFTTHDVSLFNIVARLFPMLQRVPAATRDAGLVRLERMLAKVDAPGAWGDATLPWSALLLLVEGEPAVTRAFPRGLPFTHLPFFDVSAKTALSLIKSTTGPLSTEPDVGRAFVAGAAALAHETKWIAAYAKTTSSSPERMLRTYGRVNAPETVGLVLALSSRKPLAKACAQWFAAHHELAAPELKRMTTSNPAARAALDALG